MNTYRTLLTRGALTLLLLLFAWLPAQAATINVALEAQAGNVSMPDGVSVPVWALTAPAGTPFAPIPTLTAAEGDTLIIALTNNLPAAPASESLTTQLSLVINGQPTLDETGVTLTPMAPVFITDGNGRSRVRSFTYETDPTQTRNYAWGPLNPGTYLISSGTHPSVQVPMGLYAVLVVESATPGQAYANAGSAFDQQAVALFSELDPDLNAAVAGDSYGTAAYPTALAIGYHPQYFLINGQPWSQQKPPLLTVAPGETVLLRSLNAGIRPRIPVLHNVTGMTLLAEDGQPILQDNQLPMQHSLDLVAGKTIDALFVAPANHDFLPLHDRMLGLKDGGMLDMIAVVDPADIPVDLSVEVDGTGTGQVTMTSLPGGINCPTAGLCTGSYPPNSVVALHATPDSVDTALSSWKVYATADLTMTDTLECSTQPDCVITLDVAKTVTATFTTNATTLDLVAPAPGETVPIDSAYNVRWTAPADALTFDLAYSLGPGTPFVKIGDRVAGRSLLWSLPLPMQQTSTARLAIISYNAAGQELQRDISESFSLQSAFVITSPQAGDALTSGTTTNITWTARTSLLPIVSGALFYRLSPFDTWTPITTLDLATLTAVAPSYTWTVAPVATSTTTAQVALILYDTAGSPLSYDVSDAFSIDPAVAPGAYSGGLAVAESTPVTPPRLQLLLPNGDEVVPLSGITVLWQDALPAASYRLELSQNSGDSWTVLAEGITDTQHNWIPDPALSGSSGLLLQITAVDENGAALASDESDAGFAVE